MTAPSGSGGAGRFLTDVIVQLGFADRPRVAAAIEAARTAGRTPESILLQSGELTTDQYARALAERYGLDHLDLTEFEVDMAAANLVPASVAKRLQAVPVAHLDERTVLVAVADPANVVAADDIGIITRLRVRLAVVSGEDMTALIARLNRLDDMVAEAVEDDDERHGPAEITDLRESAEDAPVIKLVHSIVAQAIERGASDIHFEPDSTGEMRVRFRVDGVLSAAAAVPRRMVAGVVSRIKIIAELDISERRVPQDGRVGLTVEGRAVDIRIVTLPTVHGESVVMRILDKQSLVVDLARLGMAPSELEAFERACRRSHGAILVTGPTGSGKSTSLYGALTAINSPEKNVVTIEDPVEYQIAGITQVPVHPRAGLTFATGLRSMMRADPDVIMVGEIRDRETAQIAVEAALTGHLVLSTLHTNDAPTAVTRLTEMGIEPFLLGSAVECVVAQRLARVLCAHCKRRAILDASMLRAHGYVATLDVEAYEPVGCARCAHTGYKGRIGLFEVMPVTDALRSLIVARAPADEIAALAERGGMRRLRDDGLAKVHQGITSIAEIGRVLGSS
ncbi:MAG: GspE/PulE family protein [Actinomycetota bacterium]|nr:GspE/PulE family protein [Actinomycetota bacterium]